MLRLRWITLLAGSSDEVCEQVVEHLGLSRCHHEPEVMNFGLSSTVFPLGVDQFLEVSAPVRDDASPARQLRRGGPGVYMLVFQVDELESHRHRLSRERVRIVGDFDEQFPRGRWRSLHLHPADVGGAIVSLDTSDPADDFTAVPVPWRAHVRSQVAGGLVGVELHGADPDALSRRWSAALGVTRRNSVLRLDEAELRCVRGEGPDRVGVVELRATDRTRAGASFTIAQTRFRLV